MSSFLMKNYLNFQYVVNQQFNIKNPHQIKQGLCSEHQKNGYKTSILQWIFRPNTDPVHIYFPNLPMEAYHL